MTTNNKEVKTHLLVGNQPDSIERLATELRSRQRANGNSDNGQQAGIPVGADTYRRRLEEVGKGIQERAARRIGRNNPDSIQY